MVKTIDRDGVLAQLIGPDEVKLTKHTFQMLLNKLDAQDKRIKTLESQIVKIKNTAMIMEQY